MALWTWQPGDPIPELPALDGFGAASGAEPAELARLTGLDAAAVAARLAAGHRCYVARLGAAPIAYGWVARAGATIGELDVAFRLGGADAYLWDFATLPAWRGRGVYPRLLQRILRAEGVAGRRFWIINAPENVASAKGIAKAGFRVVGDLAFTRDGRAGVAPTGDQERAQLGAALLGVPIVQREEGDVSPCWCCVMDALRRGGEAACWPEATLAAEPCGCALAAPAGAAR